jgi:beta-lactamase superfamily II metal-dependent hydrolase
MRPMRSLWSISLTVLTTHASAATMTAHVIDVGQGAATLLEFACGAVLVDLGGEQNPKFKSRQGLERPPHRARP